MLMSTPATFRVLIVEDEPSARSALHDLLVEEGYLVDTASRGDVALQRQRAAPPDLLLTDLGLPDVDGLELARISRDQSGCAVLVMTGNEHLRHAKLEFAVVMKPIDFDALLVQMRRALTARESP